MIEATPQLTAHRVVSVAVILLVALLSSACVTVGDHRREMKELEKRIQSQQAARGTDGIADMTARVDELGDQVRSIQGRLDVAEKTASDALAEARRARQQLAAASAAAGRPVPSDGGEGDGPAAKDPSVSEELASYRAAYASWREDRHEQCVDEFRSFLQTYPSSEYADDAAYWMADCHFKQGDFKNAVLRFDDVVRNYPTGNKAPDALYKQGESLLRLGPRFNEAAKRAFERVTKEYPDSARAAEATKQIKLLAAG